MTPAFDAETLEAGRKLFAQECRFMLSVADLAQLPPDDSVVEIAFAGRSNVGKSSLVNALTGRNNLARASNTPGRTQQLNFFALGDRLRLVDLPGYGYAKAPIKQVKAWQELILLYLRGRPGLQRVCLLIDARHGIKANDQEIITTLQEAAVVFQIVLTKIDALKGGALDRLVAEIGERLARNPAAYPVIFPTSSVKNLGVAELRASLAELA